MDKERTREILKRGYPNTKWDGEPMLGGWYTEEEIAAVVKAIRSSMDWSVGFGFFCEEIVEFERQFADYCGTEFAVSITSAGAGVEMAIMMLDLQPGDEVISPAINFIAADYAVIGHGGKLVLADVDARTLCIDPADVEKRITPNTRAIVATHMNGLSASMDELTEIAKRHPHPKHGPLVVIGDAARACGGEYKGTRIGKLGSLNVFSFHTMKLMTTLGEGGMITTDDSQINQRMRELRMWGADTGGGGANYKMTKIQAAVGQVQLRRLDEMNAARYRRATERNELLKDARLTLPFEPSGLRHTYYLYTCLVPEQWRGAKRDLLIRMLKEEYGVGCGVLNPPTYTLKPLIQRHIAGQETGLPISNEIGARLFCPSLHPLMTKEDNEYIAAAMLDAVERVARA